MLVLKVTGFSRFKNDEILLIQLKLTAAIPSIKTYTFVLFFFLILFGSKYWVIESKP